MEYKQIKHGGVHIIVADGKLPDFDAEAIHGLVLA